MVHFGKRLPTPREDAVRWTSAAGAWLGLGAAPAALILGAAMAHRHGGAIPLLALAGGTVLMALLLFGQGSLGLHAPHGENAALTELAPRYLPPWVVAPLGAILAVAMIGWNGFNVGLGGASLAKVSGLPGPFAALTLAAVVLAASFLPPKWNNRIAVATTLAALALVAICVLQLPPPKSPVSLSLSWLSAGDVVAMGGYISVFALRAPDFSRGLSSRLDLAKCVALLVLPAAVVIAAGAGVWLRTGSTDVVSALAGVALYGNVFVTAAVFAPALTTTFSGALALRSVWPQLSTRAGMLIVAVPGAVLAAFRFDRALIQWLTLLAATLPPLIIPMAVEGWRRRRGHPHRKIPMWTWLPAGLLATALTLAGSPSGPMLGIATAGLATLAWQSAHRAPARPQPDPAPTPTPR